MNVWARCALALLGGGAAMFAQAQVQPQPPLPLPSPDATAQDAPAALKPLWELGLGVGALRLPDYVGSDVSRTYVLPWPYVVYRGTWLKADRDGARAVLIESRQFTVDLSATAHPPTRSRDDAARQGMPDLPGTVEVGPNLNLTLAQSEAAHWRVDLRLPLRGAITLQRAAQFAGTTFSPNVNLDLGVGASRWKVGLLSGPVFADRPYNSLVYGVDPAYATDTRAAYRARAGYAGWQSVASTSVRWGSSWVGAFVRYDRLQGAVFEDSPLVRRRDSLTLGFGVSWILATSSARVASND